MNRWIGTPQIFTSRRGGEMEGAGSDRYLGTLSESIAVAHNVYQLLLTLTLSVPHMHLPAAAEEKTKAARAIQARLRGIHARKEVSRLRVAKNTVHSKDSDAKANINADRPRLAKESSTYGSEFDVGGGHPAYTFSQWMSELVLVPVQWRARQSRPDCSVHT